MGRIVLNIRPFPSETVMRRATCVRARPAGPSIFTLPPVKTGGYARVTPDGVIIHPPSIPFCIAPEGFSVCRKPIIMNNGAPEERSVAEAILCRGLNFGSRKQIAPSVRSHRFRSHRHLCADGESPGILIPPVETGGYAQETPDGVMIHQHITPPRLRSGTGSRRSPSGVEGDSR